MTTKINMTTTANTGTEMAPIPSSGPGPLVNLATSIIFENHFSADKGKPMPVTKCMGLSPYEVQRCIQTLHEEPRSWQTRENLALIIANRALYKKEGIWKPLELEMPKDYSFLQWVLDEAERERKYNP